jgi:hypothetical protein
VLDLRTGSSVSPLQRQYLICEQERCRSLQRQYPRTQIRKRRRERREGRTHRRKVRRRRGRSTAKEPLRRRHHFLQITRRRRRFYTMVGMGSTAVESWTDSRPVLGLVCKHAWAKRTDIFLGLYLIQPWMTPVDPIIIQVISSPAE